MLVYVKIVEFFFKNICTSSKPRKRACSRSFELFVAAIIRLFEVSLSINCKKNLIIPEA
jgi:hypothetical protein